MKFKIQMKDPDGVYESLKNAAQVSIPQEGLSSDEVEVLIESRQETLEEIIKEWFRWSEYVTIEIDTEAKTATVCKAS